MNIKEYIIVPPMRKGKKYSVLKWNKKEKTYKYLLSFGSDEYSQYYDSTPLKLWSHKDHLDEDRRSRFYARHGYTDDKESAKYYSNKFLW